MLDRWRDSRSGEQPGEQPVKPEIRVRHLDTLAANFVAGDVCITMLAAEIEPDIISRLVAANCLWIRYEYLTAEPWSDSHHCLPSPHPVQKITQWFYFPGFTPDSGGLLREQNITTTRAAFEPADARRWLNQFDLAGPADALTVCVFGYPDKPLNRFIHALAEANAPVHIICHQKLYETLGRPGDQSDLTFAVHPWFDQADFDRLLWSCDVNLVRGEDSWIRAHWANRPLLWQPYRQEELTHIGKLNAFTERLTAHGNASAASCAIRLMNAISPSEKDAANETDAQTEMNQAVAGYVAELTAIGEMHANWNRHLMMQTSLTDRLAAFIADHLQ